MAYAQARGQFGTVYRIATRSDMLDAKNCCMIEPSKPDVAGKVLIWVDGTMLRNVQQLPPLPDNGTGPLPTPDDTLLKQLFSLYGVEGAGLLPTRSQLVINLNEGRISVEDSEVSTEGLSGPDEILTRYLALVYHLRNMPLGTAAHLRDLDLEVLSTALEIETTDIKKRLNCFRTPMCS